MRKTGCGQTWTCREVLTAGAEVSSAARVCSGSEVSSAPHSGLPLMIAIAASNSLHRERDPCRLPHHMALLLARMSPLGQTQSTQPLCSQVLIHHCSFLQCVVCGAAHPESNESLPGPKFSALPSALLSGMGKRCADLARLLDSWWLSCFMGRLPGRLPHRPASCCAPLGVGTDMARETSLTCKEHVIQDLAIILHRQLKVGGRT